MIPPCVHFPGCVMVVWLMALFAVGADQLDLASVVANEMQPSDFLDFREFLQFSASYDVANVLKGANLFAVTSLTDNNVVTRWRLEFSCSEVFISGKGEEPQWPPPTLKEIERNNPEYFKDLVLSDAAISLSEFYIEEKRNRGAGEIWTRERLDEYINQPSTCGQYGEDHCERALKQYQNFVHGKRGVVLGTQMPWAEGALIRAGAEMVTTVEYMSITSEHPQIKAITPDMLAASYLSGGFDAVDFVFTFSSVEHDGLGRYGDPLNAFADLESIARMHCLLRPGGVLFLAVPVGRDEVHYNAHRIYGYRRMSVVLSLGFKILGVVNNKPFRMDADNKWNVQPIFVLEKV